MLCMIFQYDWELVLIQRISIGFKAILEKPFTVECIVFVNVKIRAQVAVGSYAVFSHTACSIFNARLTMAKQEMPPNLNRANLG